MLNGTKRVIALEIMAVIAQVCYFVNCRRSLRTSHWTRQQLVPEPSWRREEDWRCVSLRHRAFFDARAERPASHPTRRWNGASRSRGLTWIPSTNRPAIVPKIPTSSTRLTSPPGSVSTGLIDNSFSTI